MRSLATYLREHGQAEAGDMLNIIANMSGDAFMAWQQLLSSILAEQTGGRTEDGAADTSASSQQQVIPGGTLTVTITHEASAMNIYTSASSGPSGCTSSSPLSPGENPTAAAMPASDQPSLLQGSQSQQNEDAQGPDTPDAAATAERPPRYPLQRLASADSAAPNMLLGRDEQLPAQPQPSRTSRHPQLQPQRGTAPFGEQAEAGGDPEAEGQAQADASVVISIGQPPAKASAHPRCTPLQPACMCQAPDWL